MLRWPEVCRLFRCDVFSAFERVGSLFPHQETGSVTAETSQIQTASAFELTQKDSRPSAACGMDLLLVAVVSVRAVGVTVLKTRNAAVRTGFGALRLRCFGCPGFSGRAVGLKRGFARETPAFLVLAATCETVVRRVGDAKRPLFLKAATFRKEPS